MSQERWSRTLKRLGMSAERAVDMVADRLRSKLHKDTPLHIIAFRGYGTRGAATLSGRVLRYKSRQTDSDNDNVSLWNNLKANYARFDTDEVAGVVVGGHVSTLHINVAGGARTHATLDVEAVTDEEGYFTLQFDKRHLRSSDADQLPVQLSLSDYQNVTIDGDSCIQIQPAAASFGVISDIDDTVLITEATSLVSMMRLTLLGSVHTRVAFKGVAEFYSALHQGKNPFFYVSSSPWNLYEFLTDFMHHNAIVPGPLMLRDFGIDETKFIAGSHLEHKLLQIRNVLDAQPALEFLLIGDSGQDDPEIYSQIVDEYPQRIKAIYIRDVSGDSRRQAIQTLVSSNAQKSVDMLLIPDTLSAARHAAARGWLDERCVDEVKKAVRLTAVREMPA